MTLTAGLAIWGAVLSTLLAVLKLIEFFRDRVNIKVTVRGGMKVFFTQSPYGDAPLLVVTAANRGKRPVTITGAGLLTPHRDLLFTDSVKNPVDLKEGKSHDYIVKEDEVKSERSLNPDKYVAFVRDATGRVFWSHNFLIRFIKLRRIK